MANTPIIRLRKLAPKDVDVFVKCEAINPMLSVKDRLSAGMIEWGHATGRLTSGQTVVDALNGSSGLGLVHACREHGHQLVVVVGRDCAAEWQQLMRFMGAKVLVADDPKETASRVADHHGWFLLGRHRTEANEWVHATKTGREILDAMDGVALSHFVAPHGTGGMLRGVGQLLRTLSPATRICVVEQDHRPHPEYESVNGPHPSWPTSLLKGWTTDFEPRAIELKRTAQYVDEFVSISGHESMMVARALAQSEGIFTGISGGALAAGALQVARAAPPGSNVLTVLLDTSHFHLSTPLVEGVPAVMSDEEASLAALAHQDEAPSKGRYTDSH